MKSLLFLLTITLCQMVMAGQGGNGGGAFVCRDNNGKILSAELVDLYEAQAQFSLTVIKNNRLTAEEQLDVAVSKIGQANIDFLKALTPHLNKVREVLSIQKNTVMENTNDFHIKFSPASCSGGVPRFEQLAIYTETGELVVKEEIWRVLSNTDQAALYLHEAVYSLARELYESETSEEARRTVAYVFSNLKPVNYSAKPFNLAPVGVAPNKKWACEVSFYWGTCFAEGSYKCLNPEKVVGYGSSIHHAWNSEILKAYRESTYRKGCNRIQSTSVRTFEYQLTCSEEAKMVNSCIKVE